MTRTINSKTQSFVPAPVATAPRAARAYLVSGQKAFGKSIGSMPNIDTLIDT